MAYGGNSKGSPPSFHQRPALLYIVATYLSLLRVEAFLPHHLTSSRIKHPQHQHLPSQPSFILSTNPKCRTISDVSSPPQTQDFLQDSSSPKSLQEMALKFQSYASNIARTRRSTTNLKKSISIPTTNVKGDRKQSQNHACRTAINSLLYTLTQETKLWKEAAASSGTELKTLESNNDSETILSFTTALNQALIHSLRAAADYGDYMFMDLLLSACVDYASHLPSRGSMSQEGWLDPRVLGEAISEMGRTGANTSKVKRVWNLLWELEDQDENNCILTSSPSAFEVNCWIRMLARKGKWRAALKVVREKVDLPTDEYTASALLNMLEDSILTDRMGSGSNNLGVMDHKNEGEGGGVVRQHANGSSSPCWQWNEAQTILKEFALAGKTNNHVFAAALKVNQRAMERYNVPGRKHAGAKFAMSILEEMKKVNISPDVVTCSAVMSAFDTGNQWKAALALLNGMENQNASEEQDWTLPHPNVYTYSSAISACARCGRYTEAIQALNRMTKTNDMDVGSLNVAPNAWVYNAALVACGRSGSSPHDKNQTDARWETALEILERMEQGALAGDDTAPDAVTYNSALAALGGLSFDDDEEGLSLPFYSDNKEDIPTLKKKEQLVCNILDKMILKKLPRDSITYRNAMLTCTNNANAAIRILQKAFDDTQFMKCLEASWGTKEGKLYLTNVALSVCASNGDMNLVAELFTFLTENEISPDSTSLKHIIKALGNAGYCEDSMVVLNAMKGDVVANKMFNEMHEIDIISSGINDEVPMIDEFHYSVAITECLRDGKLYAALKILNGMKLHGLTPNFSSLEGIIHAYCKLATNASTSEFSEAREASWGKKRKSRLLHAKHVTSKSRASAALAMMKSLSEPSIKVRSAVASACAAAGMWMEARKILWDLHTAATREKEIENSHQPVQLVQESALTAVPKLHRSLLKLSARSGNVTAALWYADAIQDLNSKLARRRNTSLSSQMLNRTNNDPGSISAYEDESINDVIRTYGIGMKCEDWKLVMIAASKSSHWKVCLGTLQFLRPFVEATHHKHTIFGGQDKPSISDLDQEYKKLERSLTAAVLSFEVRSQYAWADRAISDWIEWSGRRPRKEAVFSACRILSSRGRGNQVNDLLLRVMQVPSSEIVNKSALPTYETSYEMAVYTEAITALYKDGLYDNADYLYIRAIKEGYLPLAGVETVSDDVFRIDLHGMNKAIAHSAVRVSLQHLVQSKSSEKLEHNVMIITGRGKRSLRHLRPVLRPEVQRMLMEEFYPPMGSMSVRGNMGALTIEAKDVNAWLDRQQQQKGVRFLAIADALKSITTASVLKQLLLKKTSEQ